MTDPPRGFLLKERNYMLNTIALKRLGLIISLESDRSLEVQEHIDFYTLKLELMNLGVMIEGYDNYKGLTLTRMKEIIQEVRELRGGDVNYVPLFANFPEQRPNDIAYLARRLAGHWGLNTFDMQNFGHNPISQMGNHALWARVAVAQEMKLQDRKSKWIRLKIVGLATALDDVSKWIETNVYGATPVQEVLWSEIDFCRNKLNILLDPKRIICKETLARICKEQFTKFNRFVGNNPTDVLRLFAALKGQDVSLAEDVSFSGLKLSKPQRRNLMIFLNGCTNLEEDLLRYAPLWKAMGSYLHPKDWKREAPKAVSAFENLYRGNIKTFESKWKNAEDADKLNLLATRPGTFVRNLAYVCSTCNTELVAQALLRCDLTKVPFTTLLSVYSLLAYKAKGLSNADRLFIVKSGKFWVNHDETPEEELALNAITSTDLYEPVRDVLHFELLTRLKHNEEVGGVKVEAPIPPVSSIVINPEVNDMVIPLNMKQMSDSMLSLAPGTAVTIDLDTSILRLHLYWQEKAARVDLDHSTTFVNEKLENMGSVSFNSYSNKNWVMHSGDVQSAPNGAVEYIDLVLNLIPDNISYLIFQVLNYTMKTNGTGDHFDELEKCYYGWQERMDTDGSTKQYSVNTVGNNFVAHGKGANWTPLVYDVKNRKMIIVDLYGKGSNMIQNNKYLPSMIGAISNFKNFKPTYGLLLELYAQANEMDVLDKYEEIREDTITFGMNEVGNLREKLLA